MKKIENAIATKWPISSVKLSRIKYNFLKFVAFVRNSLVDIKYSTFNHKIVEIQFPITNVCNCDCVMCDIKKSKLFTEIDPKVFSNIINKKEYCNANSIGINGGEPFLSKNIYEYLSIIINDTNINNIYIITNGYFTNDIINVLSRFKERKKKKIHLSISIDAYGKLHDTIRSKEGIFQKAIETYKEVEKLHLVDSLGCICTISKMNVYFLNDIKSYCNLNNIKIIFNIATVHDRLLNSDSYDKFSVLSEKETKREAELFLYGEFIETLSPFYFSLYYYIKTGERISRCVYHNNGITILPSGELLLCATHSKKIGSIYDNHNINNEKKNELLRLKTFYCNNCSHYSGDLTKDGWNKYYDEILYRIKGI